MCCPHTSQFLLTLPNFFWGDEEFHGKKIWRKRHTISLLMYDSILVSMMIDEFGRMMDYKIKSLEIHYDK